MNEQRRDKPPTAKDAAHPSEQPDRVASQNPGRPKKRPERIPDVFQARRPSQAPAQPSPSAPSHLDRPPRPRFDDARPRRDDSRPQSRGGYGPPRSEGSGERPSRPQSRGGYGDSRPQSRGGYGPPRSEGSGERPSRPQSRGGYGDSRPQSRGGYGDSRPQSRGGYGDSRPQSRGGYGPPRSEGSGERPPRPQSRGGYGDSRPQSRGGYGPPRSEGSGERPPRPRFDDARPGRDDAHSPSRGGVDDSRPQRAPSGVESSGRGGRERFAETRPDPRAIAASVLERVLVDSAYAAAALSTAIERHPQLDERARALTTELVYTALRTRQSLEAQLASQATRGLPEDPAFLSHLLVAAVQILYLDHRRAPVAVDVAVSQIDALRGPRMAGFANALLRRVVDARPSFDRADAMRKSLPEWLREALCNAVGAEEADLLLGVAPESGLQHPVTLRIRPTRPIPDWLAQAPVGQHSPLARRVAGVGDPRRLAGYSEGDFVIQEEGAQLIALALGVRPGERVLDACAGRGQKTTLLAEQVFPNGSVCATDLHPRKLEALAEELERLGLSGVTTAAVDWSRGAGGMTELFDAALVDAPCTGTGTLRRRPEIAMRLGPDDATRLGELATALVRNVASRVRPGGRLVYAVCSVLPEEGERVVEAVTDLLEPAVFDLPELQRALGSGATMGRLLPGKHGTDGYFLANFRRR